MAYALFFFYLIFLLLASKKFSKSIIIAFLHCHRHWHRHPTLSQIVSNSYKFFDCRCQITTTCLTQVIPNSIENPTKSPIKSKMLMYNNLNRFQARLFDPNPRQKQYRSALPLQWPKLLHCPVKHQTTRYIIPLFNLKFTDLD